MWTLAIAGVFYVDVAAGAGSAIDFRDRRTWIDKHFHTAEGMNFQRAEREVNTVTHQSGYDNK